MALSGRDKEYNNGILGQPPCPQKETYHYFEAMGFVADLRGLIVNAANENHRLRLK